MRRWLAACTFLVGFLPSLAVAQPPPPVPALPDTERRTSYALTASTCPACSVGFALYGTGTDYGQWLELWLTTGTGTAAVTTKLTAVTDWTLSSVTGPLATIPRPITNATITLTSARTGTLQIVGAERPRRLSQFSENEGVAARDLNRVITDLFAHNRETWDKLGRAILTAPGDTIVGRLPNAAVRAGGILGFDASGNPLITSALTGLGNVVGPNVSIVGHIPVFANTSGTLLADGGVVGTGDVTGPAGATLNHAVTFADATGKVLKDSGLTLTPSTGTITITNAKSLIVTNTITLSATDGFTYSFPAVTDTVVTVTATQTLTNKTLTAPVLTAPVTGVIGSVLGQIDFAGSTSGSTRLQANPIAAGTLTLPAANDTLVGKATTDTFTNKTFDTAGTGNAFAIAGTAISSVSGTGAVVLRVSPALVTPDLGVATATSINKVTITTPAVGATLTIATGKTLTVSNSLTFAGTDATSFVFPSTSDTVVTATASQILTNKTLTTPTITGPTITGGTYTAITGLGIRSTGTGAFDLTFANTENLTAGRTLTFTTNNAARTIDISGNLTLSASFTNAGGNALTLTTTGTTNITLPTTGTLVNSAVTTLSNLASIGTLTTGVWNASVIGGTYGGTGVNNGANTITLGGNVSTASAFVTTGAFPITLTATATSNATLPAGTQTLAALGLAQTFTALNQFTSVRLSAGLIYPTSDSTTALQIMKADGTTRIVAIDTTNARVGINKTAGAFDLDVNNNANIGGQLTFATTTITGLTINNSPNASNDYFLYYSNADGAIRRCTVGACTAAGVAGVSSVNGLTGSLSLAAGPGISVASGGTTVTVTSTAPVVVPQGRLTPISATPVVTTSNTGYTLLYYTAYVGRLLSIYDGTDLKPQAICIVNITTCQISLTLGSNWAANSAFDVFITLNASVVTMCTVAWTNTTTRATALAMYNGLLTNATSATCRDTNSSTLTVAANQGTYVGSFYTNGSTGQIDYDLGGPTSGGRAASLGVCNYYNRVNTRAQVTDSGITYTYTSATVRQARASAGNQISFMNCNQEDAVHGTYNGSMRLVAAAQANGYMGMNLDATNSYASACYVGLTNPAAVLFTTTLPLTCAFFPGIGKRFISANESSDGSNANSFDFFVDSTLSAVIRN